MSDKKHIRLLFRSKEKSAAQNYLWDVWWK